MASLSQRGGIWNIHFRFGGRQFMRSLDTPDAKLAEGWKGRIEETLLDIERGKLTIPPDADPWEFIKTDGRRTQKPELPKVMTLEGLESWYFEHQVTGGKDQTTLRIERIHFEHFKRLLLPRTPLSTITGQVLQEKYINTRAKEKWAGKLTAADTIRKEINTLRMAWNRAHRLSVAGVLGRCPTGDLNYPKTREKPPFQTWDQIKRVIARTPQLSDAERRALWEGLFLDTKQIAECLEHVRTKRTKYGQETRIVYFYPMLVFIAHTGARLSEAIRSRKGDFLFETGKVRIREKKRDKTRETYRYVEMSPTLARTMQEWIAGKHPGGEVTFCRFADQSLHPQTVHDDFEWFMGDSKWDVLRGFHVFRHSFASNLACKGIDQRVINELMGHSTEEQQKRYRHLFPQQTAHAVTQLFG
jgi:integrase